MMSVAGAVSVSYNTPKQAQTQNHAQPQEAAAHKARLEQVQEAKLLRVEQSQINQLFARDREVRAHEQAHVAAGGQHAGAARYQFERGPNGVNYAVSGEVSISVSKEATPQETLLKAQIIRRAALAPAEPSPQDRKVAAQATRMEAEARQELAQLQATERSEKVEESKVSEQEETPSSSANDERTDSPSDRQRNALERSYTLPSQSSTIQTVA